MFVLLIFKGHRAEVMEHRVMQISRVDLEELREAFNKIGEFHTQHSLSQTQHTPNCGYVLELFSDLSTSFTADHKA